MFQPDEDGVYARVDVAAPRRIVALVMVYLLAALLLYLALSSQIGAIGTVVLIAISIGCFWVGEKLRQAKDYAVLLTDTGLVTQNGEVLAALDNIRAVDRGALATKPSTGFSVRLKTAQPRLWQPGVWWRLGRRVGIGGITASGAAKFMAEQIALRVKDTP